MASLRELLTAFDVGDSITHDGTTFTFAEIDPPRHRLLALAFRLAFTRFVADEDDPATRAGLLELASQGEAEGDFDLGPTSESFPWLLGVGLVDTCQILTGRPRAACEALVRERRAEVVHACLCVAFRASPETLAAALDDEADNPIARHLGGLIEKLLALAADAASA